MASLGSPINTLDIAWNVLSQRWEYTSSLWNDPVSKSFERDYWTTLGSQNRATLKEMQKLAQVIAEARRRVR